MPFVEFYNAGQAGIVKDIAPHELPPEAWSDGRNVRFHDGKARQIEGYVEFDTSLCASPSFVIAVPQQNTTSDIWVYCGDTDVYAFNGSANYKLTASSISATGQNTWSGTLLSGIMVLNYQKAKPKYWVFPPNTSTTLSDLPDWSASWSCKVIRSFKNYLIALNTTEGASDYPYRVRWSHAADAGTVPQSWDAADTTKDAGYNDLLEGGDFVVDGAPLGDKFIVYKENSTWAISYVGGTLIFSFEKVYSDWGLLSRHAVVPLGRAHFVVGQSEIYLHDGYNDPQPLLSGRLRKYFYGSIARSATDKVFCVLNQPRREIWVCYPTDDAGTIRKALIWNYSSNTWSIRDVPSLVNGSFGGVDYTGTAQTWNAQTTTWDSALGNWDTENYKEARVIVASKDNSRMYLIDSSWQQAGQAFTSWLERLCLPIDGTNRQGDPKPAENAMKMVRAVWPRITSEQAGTISIYVGWQDNPMDTVTWRGPFRFNPQTQQKIDCRVTGRYIAIRFESSAASGWVLDSYGIDVSRAGRF